MLKSTLTIVAMILVLGSTASHATLINYDEALDGDLPDIFATPASFTLDMAGVNVWKGSSATPTPSGLPELDYFNIDIAVGLQVTSFTLTIKNLIATGNGAINAFTKILSQDLSTIYAELRVGDSPLTSNPIPVPWDVNDPLAVQTTYSRGPSQYYSWDWEVTLVAEPIPEPATLALMGLGLAGIGYRRHRSKIAA